MVESLPDSWKSWGRGVEDRVKRGEIDPRFAYRAAEQVKADAQASAIDPFKLVKFQQDTLVFNQDQTFKTFTAEDNSIRVGDAVLPVAGTLSSAKVAEELKGTFIPNFNSMNGMFQDLMELGEGEGAWDNAIDKAKADALVKSIQGLMREDILGPGTVQESERVILDNIVKNPFTKMDSLSAEESINLLRGLQTRLSDKFKNKLTSFGLQVGTGTAAQSGGTSVTTTSGKTVETLDLDNL